MSAPDPERLAQLRARIDALDETLHRALVERSGIIDELIHAKGSRASNGAIFRPGREADMFRRLCERHEGSLSLIDVEHIWHVVIAAHTALQAPYSVFVDVSGDPLPSWDVARFLVGFTVPVEPCGSPELVLDAMEEAGSALGLVPVAARGEWWLRLGARTRVMARTPAIARDGREAGAAHWVLAPPLSDPVPFDVKLTRLDFPAGVDAEMLDAHADAALMAARTEAGQAWLVGGEVPRGLVEIAVDTVDCGGYHRAVQA